MSMNKAPASNPFRKGPGPCMVILGADADLRNKDTCLCELGNDHVCRSLTEQRRGVLGYGES